MLFLWVFGDNVEDATGHWRFPILYLAGGVIAGLVEVAVDPGGRVPVVGASGAIAGVLGAYLVLHPRRSLLILVARSIPVRLNVGLVLVLWMLIQIGGGLIFGGDYNNDIAWWAHVGGFVAGMALIVPLRRRDVPLFDGRPLDVSVFYRRLKTSRNGDRRQDNDSS
jgi:membrane associated rhomboid family serine protease